MTLDELKTELQLQFDEGGELTPALRDALEQMPEAKAYWQQLQVLESSLWRIPLETPSPDLVTRLQHRVARDREIRYWKQAAAMSAVLVVAVVSLAVGWRYPEYATPQTWWHLASEYLPEQEWLENTTPLEDQLLGAWAAFEANAQSLALPLPLSLGLAAAAVIVLVIFNATGARVLHAAGGGSVTVPHHHNKGV